MPEKKLYVAKFIAELAIRAESDEEAERVAMSLLGTDDLNQFQLLSEIEDLRAIPAGWRPENETYPIVDATVTLAEAIKAGMAPLFIHPPQKRRNAGDK